VLRRAAALSKPIQVQLPSNGVQSGACCRAIPCTDQTCRLGELLNRSEIPAVASRSIARPTVSVPTWTTTRSEARPYIVTLRPDAG
jgi:hypothetical protein